MGAYSPLPWADLRNWSTRSCERVLQPTVDEMRRRGTPFSGLLYAGLAITSRGVRVIEFNARFGDPETQVVLARLQTPLAGLLLAAATGTLADVPPLRWSDDAAVTVVVASHNYPGPPRGRRDHPGSTSWAGRPDAHRAARRHGVEPTGDVDRRRAAGCCPWSASGKTLAAARERRTPGSRRSRLDGPQHRTDIAAAAALSAT